MAEIAIVGAGPYGLSIAAHLKGLGVPFRIFGRPMDSWRSHMPKGMLLKSDGFASNLSDPAGELTLEKFCASQQIPYADKGIPVSLDTFSAYGMAFREKMVGTVEDRQVTSVKRAETGFTLRLDDGEEILARRVLMAVGITHFKHTPALFEGLPMGSVSHSFDHHDLEPLMNKSLVVVGGGSSAIDLAALLHEKGADVTLIVRDRQLIFHDMQPVGKRRSLWEQIRRPGSGLGPGIKSRLYCEFPHWFRFLPRELRVKIVRTHLGPSGGWFAKEKVLGRVPLLLAHTPVRVAAKGGKIHLVLRDINRKEQEMVADHVVAATGYKVDISRLTFLSGEIRSSLETLAGAPVLSQSFESSVPGLYFVGLASALSFGPLMRFAYGAEFAARHLTSALVKSVAREKALVPAAQEVSLAK